MTYTPKTSKNKFYYDNGTICVYLGKFGWNWIRTAPNGAKSGDVGYGSLEAALVAARS